MEYAKDFVIHFAEFDNWLFASYLLLDEEDRIGWRDNVRFQSWVVKQGLPIWNLIEESRVKKAKEAAERF